ncbi:hypothetical protein [Tunturiibacter gelidiferens]|uniref:Uncharacterized protein n=1 Tax=Tunturiibacter gelidiferens TaxID=3069689 RepID=A0AAU7Z160_9BACT
MVCSLNCFLDFVEADSSKTRDLIVLRYKRAKSGEAKGRSTYYTPALQVIKRTLCPDGTAEQKVAAIAAVCSSRPTWTDQANDSRKESNVRVFRAFHSKFGSKEIKIFPAPRMQFQVSKDVAVNIQPDLFFESEKHVTMLKLGLCKKPRSESAVRLILQALSKASKRKGLKLPIKNFQFLDTVSGNSFVEHDEKIDLEEHLAAVANDLNESGTVTDANVGAPLMR